MHIFYTPDIKLPDYTLNEEESKHCVKVLRLRSGESVYLVDGAGGFYTAEIVSDNPKRVVLHIVKSEKEFGKRNHYLHIAIAPTKNIDRLEWFLEKATEIGIDEITPVICDRSERRVVKEDRLIKVITAAVKQSIKAYHPKLNDAVDLKQFLKTATADEKYIAHCMDSGNRLYLNELASPHKNYVVLIGPEGDFSRQEVESALQNEYKPITLGNARLRTETAALAACFEVNYLNR